MASSRQDPAVLGFEKLLGALAPASRLVRAWSPAGGLSACLTAFEITSGIQAQYLLLRQPSARSLARNPRAAEIEFGLLKALHDAGMPCPEPIWLDQDCRWLDSPGLVMEFVEGAPDFGSPNFGSPNFGLAKPKLGEHDAISSLYGSRARAMAEVLARLHALRIDAIAGLPMLEDEPALGIDESLRTRPEILAWLGSTRLSRPSLLHGDFWPGNLLWQGERLVAVLDWEDAAWGHPLRDLAIARLDLALVWSEAAMQAFTSHYLALRGQSGDSLPAWDLFAARRLAPLLPEIAAGWPDLGRPDLSLDRLQLCHHAFITRAHSALERMIS